MRHATPFRSRGNRSKVLFAEEDPKSGVFFEEDLVGVLFEEFGERGEALVDEDDVALVLIHEGTHGTVGVGVVNEEAGDDEVDFGEVELLVAAGERGGVCDTVFCELFLAEGEGGGGEVVDPDVAGVATEDEGFGSDSGSEGQDALASEEVGIASKPVGEDTGGFPALVVVDCDARGHIGDDFLLHPGMGEVHEGEGFVADGNGLEEGRTHGAGWLLGMMQARYSAYLVRYGKQVVAGLLFLSLQEVIVKRVMQRFGACVFFR